MEDPEPIDAERTRSASVPPPQNTTPLIQHGERKERHHAVQFGAGGVEAFVRSLIGSLGRLLVLSLAGELRNEVKDETRGAHRRAKAADCAD
ncbi:hypothetical protein EYF80_063046 [Liparis tanakae]|uniref:Uncharacterized protein n=1 Tax=Liparis tanakae TaxID=230148 RepID=A0A4Z2ED86_9TELE|nr:hypothetical protein EYF80_063046 [Liparis tanakae]